MKLKCPECGEEITVCYDPGEPAVTGGPPDAWYPGDPPSAEVIENHECLDELDTPLLWENYHERLLNAVADQITSEEDAYWDRRIDEHRDEQDSTL